MSAELVTMSAENKTADPRPRVSLGIRPRSLEELMQFAEAIAGSELMPKDYRNKPANVVVAIQMGSELGLAPLQALQNIAVINGRPSVWGDALLALVQSQPDCLDVIEVVEDGVATCTVHRRGRAATVRQFSVDDAKRAGLWGKAGPWVTYPERMLQMRARGFACRDAFADALRGLQSAEESADLPPEAVYVPQPVAPAKRAALPATRQAVPDDESWRDAEPVAAKPAARMQAAKRDGERSDAPAVLVPFGRNKGKAISDASVEDRDLEYLATAAERTLNDDSKSRFHDAERSRLAAYRAELRRREAGHDDEHAQETENADSEHGRALDEEILIVLLVLNIVLL